MDGVRSALPGLALLAMVPAAAWAQPETPPAPDPEDLRCLIVISALQADPRPSVRTTAVGGTLYYLGRIDGQAPGADLETALSETAEALTKAPDPGLLGRCGAAISERGAALKAAGAAMRKAAAPKAAGKQAPPR